MDRLTLTRERVFDFTRGLRETMKEYIDVLIPRGGASLIYSVVNEATEEIGISTQKLHACGPMGLSDLTTTKYILTGNGHVS